MMKWLARNFSLFNEAPERLMALLICAGYVWALSDQTTTATSASLRHITVLFGPNALDVLTFIIVGSFAFIASKDKITPFGLLVAMAWQMFYTILVLDWVLKTPNAPNAALANHVLISTFILYLTHKRLEAVAAWNLSRSS